MLALRQQGKTGEHGEEFLGAEYVTKIPVKIGVLSATNSETLGYLWLNVGTNGCLAAKARASRHRSEPFPRREN